MKTYAILFLALFSFVSGIRYEVEEYYCEDNQLRVKYENNWYDVTLFNVHIKEDSDICTYIDGTLSFELEEAIANKEENEVYVFVDDVLLQKTLIEENVASVKLASYAYKYDMKSDKEAVIAEVNREEEVNLNMYSRKMAILFFSVYILICIILIRYKMHYQKDINTHENDV